METFVGGALDEIGWPEGVTGRPERGPRLVLLGRPGAGKGTVAEVLVRRFGLLHVSTGDALREAVKADTLLGRTVARALEDGRLLPDRLVLDVVRERVFERTAQRQGVLLDGFPRTMAQAEGLAELVGPAGVDLAVELDVPADVARIRLAARKVCEVCGTPAAPPHTPGRRCTACGGGLLRRHDDHGPGVTRRLAAYDEATAPVVRWYDEQGLLVRVRADRTPTEVRAEVLGAVVPRVGWHRRAEAVAS